MARRSASRTDASQRWGENINWVRLILQLHTIGGGGGAPGRVPTRENNNFYRLQFYLYVDTTEWCHTNVMQGAITTSTKTRTIITRQCFGYYGTGASSVDAREIELTTFTKKYSSSTRWSTRLILVRITGTTPKFPYTASRS